MTIAKDFASKAGIAFVALAMIFTMSVPASNAQTQTPEDLQKMIDSGIVGITSNPTIFDNAISKSDDYDEALKENALNGVSAEDTYWVWICANETI